MIYNMLRDSNAFGEMRALSSMVEQFPFKEAVLGSSPRGLTKAPRLARVSQVKLGPII